MNLFITYLATKARLARNHVRSVRNESKLKVAVIFTWTAIFMTVGCWLFYKAFEFLYNFPVGDLLAVRVLALFFLTLFAMLVFSNILVAFSTLYKSAETEFLFSLPADGQEVFLCRFAETVAYSSWAFIFLGIPLMISYGVVFHVKWYFYPALPLFFLPFVVIAGLLGALVIMALVRIFPRVNFKIIVAVIALLGVSFLVFLFRSFSVAHLSRLDVLDQILSALKTTQSPFFPSHWLNEGVLAAGSGNLRESLFYLGLLVSNALMLMVVSLWLAGLGYYGGWAGLRGFSLKRYYPAGKGLLNRMDKLLQPLDPPTHALMMKDLRMFWRDPSQWMQFIIFFGLLIVYVSNLHNYEKFLAPEWQTRIAFLNLAAGALVLGVLTTRFVFPLISLEGKRFWIVGLAPIKRSRLLLQKFFLSIATTLIFTEALMVVSSMTLKLDRTTTLVCCATMFLMNFSMAGLAVGLGTIYPNFREDNPARIVSGLGGTLNFILSMIYVTAVVLLEGIVFWQYTVRGGGGQLLALLHLEFHQAILMAFGAVIVISIITTAVPMYLGIRNVNRLEF
jgi:ABC-2 type transport system permease protein